MWAVGDMILNQMACMSKIVRGSITITREKVRPEQNLCFEFLIEQRRTAKSRTSIMGKAV